MSGKGRCGAVLLGHLGRVGLDLMAAIVAPDDEQHMGSGGAADCQRNPPFGRRTMDFPGSRRVNRYYVVMPAAFPANDAS
jgi:hypothetical protein